MSVHIENTFAVQVPPERAWDLLTDVPRVAPCMPGAELTEVVDTATYRGVVRIKIGPVQLVLSGEAQLYDVNPAARTARMRTRASDIKGRGTAHSDIGFALQAQGEATLVRISTELTLSGAIAQYGRGAGLIREIAGQFISQFARNLEQAIAAQTGAAAADGAPPASTKTASGLGLALGASRAALGRWWSGSTPRGHTGNGKK